MWTINDIKKKHIKKDGIIEFKIKEPMGVFLDENDYVDSTIRKPDSLVFDEIYKYVVDATKWVEKEVDPGSLSFKTIASMSSELDVDSSEFRAQLRHWVDKYNEYDLDNKLDSNWKKSSKKHDLFMHDWYLCLRERTDFDEKLWKSIRVVRLNLMEVLSTFSKKLSKKAAMFGL